MLKVKEGVKWTVLRPEIYRIFAKIEAVWAEVAPEIEPVITSAMDGEHIKGSLHYKGLAVDLRTRNLKAEARQQAVALLKKKLGRDYDVILESDHIHIEYDPKPVAA